jgi:hypothetical protein
MVNAPYRVTVLFFQLHGLVPSPFGNEPYAELPFQPIRVRDTRELPASILREEVPTLRVDRKYVAAGPSDKIRVEGVSSFEAY